MPATPHPGGCHCGAIRWVFTTAQPLASLSPRACDCDFCLRHGAAWVSDPDAQLHITADGTQLGRYRQGSDQADFLLCRRCGVLVAVVATMDDRTMRGAANRRAFEARDAFAADTVVSPQRLAPDAKRARWGAVWARVVLQVD